MKPKALAVFYPGCIEFEIMLAIELLRDTFTIESCSPAGGLHHSQSGLQYQTHFGFVEVQPQDYQVVLVPGGDPYDLLENREIDRILQVVHGQGKTVAAICAGPLVLAKAGLLKGKSFTHGYGEHFKETLAPYWEGAFFQDQPFVWADNILTAQPQAHIDFAVELAYRLGAIASPEQAERTKQYYKGKRSG